MVQASFFEQIETIKNAFISNQYILYVLLVALGAIILLELIGKVKNKKVLKILCLFVYLIIFGTLLFFYHDSIFTLIDYLINNIFILLFFPNLAVYTLIIIIINIILVRTLIKDKRKIRHLNILFFILFNILFYLIINNIIKNNINIYEQLSIYTNNELLILIEMSMKLFLIWIIILLILKTTNKLSYAFAFDKHKSKVAIKPIVEDNELRISEPVLETIPTNTLQNTLVLKEQDAIPEYVDIRPVNSYNDMMDIMPIKKKKEQQSYLLTGMDDMFKEEINKQDMDNLFRNQYIQNIMDEIEKLKYNQNDHEQIKKVYDEIILSSKDLTLEDYNKLIHQLVEIKNNY